MAGQRQEEEGETPFLLMFAKTSVLSHPNHFTHSRSFFEQAKAFSHPANSNVHVINYSDQWNGGKGRLLSV